MDLFLYILEGTVNFFVASIPLIITYLQIITFKLPLKPIVIYMILIFIINLYFWIKLQDSYLALYQGFSYLLSFVIIWAKYKFDKRYNNSKKDNENKN